MQTSFQNENKMVKGVLIFLSSHLSFRDGVKI